MNESIYSKLSEKFPFLTYATYVDDEYIGIIQNADNQIVTMYVLNRMHDENLKKKFLAFGEEWWWGSNRMIPINIFFKDRFKIFRPYLLTFIAKDFNIKCGPTIGLDDYITKRIKRRSIQLVKKG